MCYVNINKMFFPRRDLQAKVKNTRPERFRLSVTTPNLHSCGPPHKHENVQLTTKKKTSTEVTTYLYNHEAPKRKQYFKNVIKTVKKIKTRKK